MNAPQPTPPPRRQPTRLLVEAAFVVLTLVAAFVGFVYWYQSRLAGIGGSN